MKICVTGGAGYIGSHVCKALANAGHEVIVYDNLSTGHRQFVKWGPFEHGDIRDNLRLEEVLNKYQPDGIIHFAASAYVGESVIKPEKYFSNNVGGTFSLLEAARRSCKPKIVVSGTCAIYGQPDAVPISEKCEKKPMNPYGASKLFMEQMLSDYERAHNMQWTSLRYFNAAGSDPECETGELHEPETHLIPRVIMAALGKIDAIEVFGQNYPTQDGTCIRDYIHVDDLAKAHILAMERLIRGGTSLGINLGTEKGASVLEIIDGVKKVSGKDFPVKMGDNRAGDPAILIADTTLAKNELNWQAEKDLNTMLEDSWRFLKDNL